MALPASWTAVKLSTVDLPVSGSISKSQIERANDPPTFLGLIHPLPAIDPPVLSSWDDNSLNDIVKAGSALEEN